MNVTVLAVVAGVLLWTYQSLKPRPPLPLHNVTSPRVKLSDGRNLAYRELGVPKEKARHKVILVHGYASSKDLYIPLSHEFMERLGLYIVAFDRAGYGESDPNPERTIRSETLDLQELADKLDLGPKFHLLGLSIGNYITWGCLHYIPSRLAGAALVVPVVNYWWPSFPSSFSREALNLLMRRSQWSLWVAHIAPWLLHWWVTQKWFPSSIVTDQSFPPCDLELIKMMMSQNPTEGEKQSDEYESLHRDLKMGFGKWEFDPMEMKNPFPENEGSRVYLWQGYQDGLVPFQLQRFLAKKLPWISYLEVPNGGHLIIHDRVTCEAIFMSLLLGQAPSFK